MEEALLDVLVQNKDEFVQLFMERVDLKTFLDEKRLELLYTKVFKTCVREGIKSKNAKVPIGENDIY